MNWLKRLFGRFQADGVADVPDESEIDFVDIGSESGLGFGLFEGSVLHSEIKARSVDESVVDWLDEIEDRRLRR